MSTYIFCGTNNEVYLFSAVKGNINIKGLPTEGVKITRTYPKLGSIEDVTETIYSDKNGNFEFDEVKGKLGIMRFLPHEAVIFQTIEAHYLNDTYLLWYTCKRNYKPLGEFKYLDRDPILNQEMSLAYNEGYILLNCDLESNEELIQRVNDNIAYISITDFNFPYEDTLKKYQIELESRKDEFTTEIEKWFSENPSFIEIQTNNDENWNEMELDNIKPYKNVIIQSVKSIKFTENLSLYYFEEDYNKEYKRVTISGDIILNVINPKDDIIGARVWLSSAIFKIGKDKIIFEPQEHYFIINSSNIDPEIID